MQVATKIFLGAIAGAALTGCQTIPFIDNSNASLKPYPPGSKMAPAPLPKYRTGEFFIFDNGATEVVRDRKGHEITWKSVRRSGREIIRTGSANFLIPFYNWENDERRSRGDTNATHNTMWPLKVGNRAKIETRQLITTLEGTQPNQVTRNWECEVVGTSKVTVRAGTFDTFVTTCKRYEISARGYELRSTRRFYYSPKVGHYVLYEDDHVKQPVRRKELVRYGFNSRYLAKADRRTLNRLLQKTLDNIANGKHTHWNSKTEDIKVTLTPLKSFKGEGNATCREYQSVYNISGYMRKNVRQMCKDKKLGHWVRI